MQIPNVIRFCCIAIAFYCLPLNGMQWIANAFAPQKQFEKAIVRGDVEQVKTLLEKGIDVNKSFAFEHEVDLPPLWQTLLRGKNDSQRIAIAALLLANGAEIQLKVKHPYFNPTAGPPMPAFIGQCQHFNSLLHAVVMIDQPKRGRFLLECGANPLARGSQNEIPLHIAVLHLKNEKTIQDLLNAPLYHPDNKECFITFLRCLHRLHRENALVLISKDIKKLLYSYFMASVMAEHLEKSLHAQTNDIVRHTHLDIPTKKTPLEIVQNYHTARSKEESYQEDYLETWQLIEKAQQFIKDYKNGNIVECKKISL